MLLGVGLALIPRTESGFDLLFSLIPILPFLVIAVGAGIGMWLLFKEDLSSTKRHPGILAVLSALCWAILSIAILLLWFTPGIYGYDLAIVVNSAIVITWSTLLSILFTTIALLHR